jgi:uncharacterized protein YraI
MKRLSLFALILLALNLSAVLPALAQSDANLITLNDASPAIDVVITLPADTTGTVALEFSGAAVRLTDATNAVVFSAADERLHALELNIAPNSGSHTLTVERLPGTADSVVRVSSLPGLTMYGTAERVPGLAVVSNQEVALPLTPDHPGDSVSVTVAGASMGMLTAAFPGAGATTQLVDAAGVLVVESVGGHVDGISVLIDPGTYQFTLVSSGLSAAAAAGVRLVSADDAGVGALAAPVSTQEVVAANTSCTAVVTVSSTNFRSGPGTGYTVIGYGYRDQVFDVGGRNLEDNWVLVALNSGASAWVSRGTVQTQGACSTLTAFNIPLRDAQPAPLVITGSGQSSGSYSDDDDDHGEHEEHDDDHDDGEHDDD